MRSAATNHDARVFETAVRVRYAETDQMGVVYHSNYLVWFEVGRVELLRELGFDYQRMESEQDTFVVVVEASVRYKAPAKYDESLVIRTRVIGLRQFVLHFSYEVLRQADGMLLATGETVHVITDRMMQKRSVSLELEAALRAAIG